MPSARGSRMLGLLLWIITMSELKRLQNENTIMKAANQLLLDEVVRLKGKLASLFHICNAYDGNHAKACDDVMKFTEEYIEDKLLPERD